LGIAPKDAIARDSSLGTESSVVTPDAGGLPVDVISGGAIRGANLFHSFREFNVAAGRGAYFYGPNAEIQNIIARVTGSNRSEILGFIGTYSSNGSSNPNLFLINPNGIIFGPNATLGVDGSFVASTASSLNFADGTQFSATAHPTTPLLTVSVPIGLQFGETAGGMLVQGSGLAVLPGRTLALVSADLTVEGGDLAALKTNLEAPEGRIELGSVAGPGLVSLNSIDKGWALGYEGVQNFKDIQVSGQAAVNASGEGGGDIQVQGRRISVRDASTIFADTLGSQKGGGISIQALELIVQEGAEVSAGTGTGSTGPGGTLAVTASDSVELSGTGTISTRTVPSGLFARTAGTGAGGNLTITTRQLIVQNGANVSTSTSGKGRGGTLTVTASDSVELSGTSPDNQSRSGLFAPTTGSGAAGNLTITTGQLIVQDGAQVSAGTIDNSTGQGGTLTVTASESVELSGTSTDRQNASGLFARTRGTGAAGNLTITTGSLIVQDGAQVTVDSVGSGSGDAGNLEVAARSIQLDNFGAIVAKTASGEGGNITLLSGTT
jgi:filamentous hemagglutinin family protein